MPPSNTTQDAKPTHLLVSYSPEVAQSLHVSIGQNTLDIVHQLVSLSKIGIVQNDINAALDALQKSGVTQVLCNLRAEAVH